MLIFKSGQNFSLSQNMPDIEQLDLDLSWEPVAEAWTLDASAFALTDEAMVRSDADFIFYNQPQLADGGIELQGDGRRFRVTLQQLPAAVVRIAFAATLDAPADAT